MKKKVLLLITTLVILAVSIFGLTACNDDDTPAVPTYSIAAPDGAPSVALAKIHDTGKSLGGVNLTTEIIAPENIMGIVGKGDKDFAILPSNAAYKLFQKVTSKGGTKYQIVATTTYGNLYIVGSNKTVENTNTAIIPNELKGKLIYSIGKGAIPGLLLENILEKDNINFLNNDKEALDDTKYNICYMNNGSDILGKLKEAKENNTEIYALLGEPAVTGAKNTAGAHIVADIQKIYQNKTGSESIGFPQAVFVAKESLIKDNPKLVKDVFDTLVDSANYVNSYDEPKLNYGGAKPIPKPAIKNSCIKVISAKDAKADIKQLFDYIGIENVSDDLFFEF